MNQRVEHGIRARKHEANALLRIGSRLFARSDSFFANKMESDGEQSCRAVCFSTSAGYRLRLCSSDSAGREFMVKKTGVACIATHDPGDRRRRFAREVHD